jgi:predicted nucleic acid-binding protein
MRTLAIAFGLALIAGSVGAQSMVEPPLADTRIGIDTLVREDLFAGYLSNDKARFTRGEQNLEKLLAIRPKDQAAILAWQGADQIYKAVLARDAGQSADYARLYHQAMDTLAEAKRIGPANGGVHAVIGGIMMIFADRLAPDDRAAAWVVAYQAFQVLKMGQPKPEALPVHIRGELMAGLVESAQRTGHTAEVNDTLDRMLIVTKGTPYEAGAQNWKANPDSVGTEALGCKSCHEPGRLEPTLKALGVKD